MILLEVFFCVLLVLSLLCFIFCSVYFISVYDWSNVCLFDWAGPMPSSLDLRFSCSTYPACFLNQMSYKLFKGVVWENRDPNLKPSLDRMKLGKDRSVMEVADWLRYLHIIPRRFLWLILSQKVFRGWCEESWFETSLKTLMRTPCYFGDSFVSFPWLHSDKFTQLIMFLCSVCLCITFCESVMCIDCLHVSVSV